MKPKMIYTPKRHIPIGEPLRRLDGTYVLRVKKANKAEFDEIPLELLISTVIRNAKSYEDAFQWQDATIA